MASGDVNITKAPTKKVKNLSAPTRQPKNHKMKAEWGVPSSLVSGKANDRAEGLEVEWLLGIPGKDPKKVVEYSNENKKSSTINLSNLKIGRKTYTRESFYPVDKKTKLSYVTIKVRATNSKGKGKAATNTRKFGLPRAPKIEAPTFNTQTGVVSFNIKTDAGTDHKERYDTSYTLSVYDSTTKKTVVPTGKSGSRKSTDFNVTYDVTGYQQLSYDNYVRLTLNASARGYAGDKKAEARILYVGYPAQVSILGVDVATKSASEKCTVRIKTNSSKEHPVDTVKLEYLANVEYATKEQIPGDAGWTSSDIVDNGSCSALSISVSELLPESGKHTYIRVKSIHLNEEVLYRYSEVVEVDKLFTPAPTASDDKIVILGVTAGNDGESAVVQLGWNADGQDDSTGTELSWSDAEDTWRSTEEPNVHTFTWSDGAVTVDQVTYQDSASIVVKGLEEGTKYYFRARRYLESDDGISYSDYAATTEPFLTTEKPEAVVATCDRYIPQGKPLSVRWTFSGYSLQKTWQIVDYNNPEVVVDHGEGSFGSAQISAQRLADVATNGDLTFIVGVSTGSEPVWSSPVSVSIIDAPTMSVTNTSLTHVHEEETETHTGEIASFESDEEREIDSLSVSLEPIQDLNGYDSPWPAGGGKNKLQTTGNGGTNRGITAVVNADGTISLSGTNDDTSYSSFSINGAFQTENGVSYIISGGVSADVFIRDTTAAVSDTGSGATIIGDGNTHAIQIRVSKGYAITGTVVIKPMICLSTATDPLVFAPYSNICPISGWDEVSAYVVGKNRLPFPYYDTSKTASGITFTVGSDGSVTVSGTATATVSLELMHMATNNYAGMILSGSPSGSSSNDAAIAVQYWNGGSFSSAAFETGNGLTLIASDTIYLLVRVASGATVNKTFYPMIRAVGTDSTYEPYQGTTYPVNLSDTAGTVYGGTVDVVSGVLTVDRAMVDLGTLTWASWLESGTYIFNAVVDGKKQTRASTLICSQYKPNYSVLIWGDLVDCEITGANGNSRVYIRDQRFTNNDAFTTAMSGVQLVYELATPLTYQLTPTQIMTLIGDNNVWSDAGDVTVELINVLLDDDQLTTNNLSFTVTASRICDLIVIITSQGITGQMPQGVMTQTAGDTIHSDVYSPDWTEANGVFTATVNMPTGLDFWDLGRYTLSVTAIDRMTQLQSEEVVKEFSIRWTNQAVSPEDAVTLTVIDQTDEDGDHTQAVQIDLTPPTGSRESDVYDIYRMDVEAPRLIGESFPLTYTATDIYAPFGDEVPLKYRVALRTEDGDVEFTDVEYEAPCENLRFDWQGGSLELPFGISYGDSFKKDVEIRKHLNGSLDGYWNQNIERKGSLASDVIKIVQPKAVESARALARYAGPVFVRRPDGSAFEADVQVTDLSKKNDAVVAMTFDATEIGLTQEFLLPTPFEVEEEEEE